MGRNGVGRGCRDRDDVELADAMDCGNDNRLFEASPQGSPAEGGAFARRSGTYPVGTSLVAADIELPDGPPSAIAAAAYQKYGKLVLWRITAGGVPPESAKGLTQDCFTIAFALIRRNGRPANALFFEIAHRLVMAYRARHKRRPRADDVDVAEVPASQPGTDERVSCAQYAEMVDTVMAEMSPQAAHLLRQVDFEGLTMAQVAAALGSTVSVVKGRLHRARGEFERVAARIYGERPPGAVGAAPPARRRRST